jgi:hypothetical protein
MDVYGPLRRQRWLGLLWYRLSCGSVSTRVGAHMVKNCDLADVVRRQNREDELAGLLCTSCTFGKRLARAMLGWPCPNLHFESICCTRMSCRKPAAFGVPSTVAGVWWCKKGSKRSTIEQRSRARPLGSRPACFGAAAVAHWTATAEKQVAFRSCWRRGGTTSRSCTKRKSNGTRQPLRTLHHHHLSRSGL